MIQKKDIGIVVNENREFIFIGRVARGCNVDFGWCVDYCLDFYNMERERGVSKYHAKFFSLSSLCNYVYGGVKK